MDSAENSLKNIRTATLQSVTSVQVAALFVGMLYVTGYYINSVYLQNFGVLKLELLKLEYIKIGFMFWLLLVTLLILPFGTSVVTYKIRKGSPTIPFWPGYIPNTINSFLLIAIPSFLAIVATDTIWTAQIALPVLDVKTSFSTLAIGAIISSAVGIIIFPALERVSQVSRNPAMRASSIRTYLAIEIPRIFLTIISLLLCTFAFSGGAFGNQTLPHASSYFSVVLSLGVLLGAAYLWVNKVKDQSGSALLIPIIAGGLSIFYYLLVVSYVYGVYPSIPANRGGKYPITTVFIAVDGPQTVLERPVKKGNTDMFGPFVLVDGSDDYLYISKRLFPNSSGEFPSVITIKRDNIQVILTERINATHMDVLK